MLVNAKTRIAFVIRRLDRGGAERQLIRLATALDKKRFDVTIFTFYAGGNSASEILPDCGVDLICLSKSGRWDLLFLGRLLGAVRRLRPHIIHGYMSGANEVSIIAGRACGARVVWGLRSSDLGVLPQTLIDRWMFRIGALLSRHPDRIIANSQEGLAFHAAQGYCKARMTVIPNGVDTQLFSILAQQREALRREWNIAGEILIGRVGRLDPLKDYSSFLNAAAKVSRLHPTAKFACIGDDTDCDQLRQLAAREGIAHRMIWAGGQGDMPAVYNALDICVSSSLSEGFPNTIAESMACGTPCVATDVGDSALLVGNAGVVVPSRDSSALADGILRVIADRQQYSRDRIRQRITDNFSLQRLVTRTEAEFDRLLIAPGYLGEERNKPQAVARS